LAAEVVYLLITFKHILPQPTVFKEKCKTLSGAS